MSVQDLNAGGSGEILQPVAETQVKENVDVNELKNLMDTLQKRINDQSKIIASLQKQKPVTETKVESEPAREPLKGAAALEEQIKLATEREERAIKKAINTSIIASLVESGFSEDAAKKLVPAMKSEGKFEVDENDDVTADDGSGARSVKDFIGIMLKKDDWRVLVPQKKAPEKPSHGRPFVAGNAVLQNDNGVFSGAAIRRASAQ